MIEGTGLLSSPGRLLALGGLGVDRLRLLARSKERTPPAPMPLERLAEFVMVQEEAEGRAAQVLGLAFARDTGLTAGYEAPLPRRYLWTDALALTLYIRLYRCGSDRSWLQLAERLIDQVHYHLGRFRPDDPKRNGWISGMSEVDGDQHPTAGGLRIGKPLPEREEKEEKEEEEEEEEKEEEEEWERDGQYYHYGCHWAQALVSAAPFLPHRPLPRLALELLLALHRRFLYGPPGLKRLYWKMSVDLSQPRVCTQGHHDALDGLLTAQALRLLWPPSASETTLLLPTLTDLHQMVASQGDLATVDPLGLGGLLLHLRRAVQLHSQRRQDDPAEWAPLAVRIAEASTRGLRTLSRLNSLSGPPERRVPFRELGLAQGLGALVDLSLHMDPLQDPALAPLLPLLASCTPFLELRGSLLTFWRQEGAQRGASWRGHEDINGVTLAVALLPGEEEAGGTRV